ncbi:MAG: hypothetical protein LBV19_01380 [Streptococcaceae bacterium]|jgi:hypothetical protein|nr:hypothetical protein [Streptococcaceae bacterium]
MTTGKFELSPELDQRLRDSVSNQDDFLDSVGFVLALLNFNVIAPNPLFSVGVGGHDVLPIFTAESDWDTFMANASELPENVNWLAVPFTVVFNAVLQTPIDSIGFNIKTSQNQETGNLYYFDKDKMREFIDIHAKLVNDLMSDENQSADRLDKIYLVPVYIGSPSYGEIFRLFPTLASHNYNDKEVIPIFDNVQSFARWYRYPDFGEAFKKNKGQIRGMRLKELIHPSLGENQFGNAVGVVINPMEIGADNQEDFILTWDALKDIK